MSRFWDQDPDDPDREYAYLKDEGLRHTRWPWLYDENDKPRLGREIHEPSARTDHPATRSE